MRNSQRAARGWLVRLVVLGVAMAISPVALAQEDDDEWGDDGGFDDGAVDDIGDITIAPPKPLSLRGFLRTDIGLWVERFDDNPFAKARQSLDFVLTGRHEFLQLKVELHGEYDFAYLYERDTYDDPTLDSYEWQVLSKDAYLAFSLGAVELTIGRQIVAWGEGDALSPLDVVNPRDMREPGLADLDDIRLAVLATRVGVFVGDHRVEAMILHEANFGLRQPPYGPFSPLRALFEQNPVAATLLKGKTLDYRDRESAFDFSTQQPMLRWVYKGRGVDLGAYAAYIMDRQGVIDFDQQKLAAQLGGDRIELEQYHPYHTVVGTSGAAAIDEILLKWEVGAQIGRSFNTGDESNLASYTVQQGTIFDVMLGITWSPNSDTTLGPELHQPIFLDKPDNLLFPVDELSAALRFSWTGLKDRLRVSAALSVLGLDTQFEKAADGDYDFQAVDVLVRAEVSYEVIDSLDLGVGYVGYFPGDDFGAFTGLDDHDRIFFKLRWDFTVL